MSSIKKISGQLVLDAASMTEKTTLVADDLFVIEDSAADHVKKKVRVSNLPSGEGGGLTQAQILARGLGA